MGVAYHWGVHDCRCMTMYKWCGMNANLHPGPQNTRLSPPGRWRYHIMWPTLVIFTPTISRLRFMVNNRDHLTPQRVGYEPGNDHQVIQQILLPDQRLHPTQVHTTTYIDFSSELPTYISKMKLWISKTRDSINFTQRYPICSKNDEEEQNQHYQTVTKWSVSTYKLFNKYFVLYSGKGLHEEKFYNING